MVVFRHFLSGNFMEFSMMPHKESSVDVNTQDREMIEILTSHGDWRERIWIEF
jgi:hypothetical protein